MGTPCPRGHLRLTQVSTSVILAILVGLVIALLLSVLMAFPLSTLPGLWGQVTPNAVSFLLCLIFISITVSRRGELPPISGIKSPAGTRSIGPPVSHNRQLIVDTSTLIDGRIADISQAGFIPGSLIIPRFVLDELQHIADSYNAMRRNRGRRGLEILTRLQQESTTPLEISDLDASDITDVDSKLAKLATSLDCAIITNDFNLNQVAKIQGVRVLNVNELADAVRPVVFPGEEMQVKHHTGG